jgi:hypothetical protein
MSLQSARPALTRQPPPAPQAYVIEVDDDAVGIVVRDSDGYTFHAAASAYYPLDHRRFASAAAAQKAAQALRHDRAKTLRGAGQRRAN